MKYSYIILIATGLISNITLNASNNIKSTPGLGVQKAEQIQVWRKSASKIDDTSKIEANFYTGKPYDQDQEAYTFKYRNLNSTIGRWATTDPSGFPDGANNSIYAPNPFSAVDPDGLDEVHVTGTPSSYASGTNFSIQVDVAAHQTFDLICAEMVVTWIVPSNLSGWVVQHVQLDGSGVRNDSDNSAYYDGSTSFNHPKTASYWEAWRVDNGSPEAQDGYGTDIFGEDTHGVFTVTGKVDFYLDSVFSSNDPSTWTGSVPEANGLYSTTTQPSWWTGSGFNHNMTLSWE